MIKLVVSKHLTKATKREKKGGRRHGKSMLGFN